MAFDPVDPLNSDFHSAISGTIERFLLDTRKRLINDPVLDFSWKLSEAFTKGGKRIRPGFCYWSYVAAAGQTENAESILRVAASLDLMHVGILIHDDVMDGSDFRRGIHSAHRQFEDFHQISKGHGNAAEYGRAGAIQLGNLLQAWSIELAEEGLNNFDSAAYGREILALLREDVITGQLLDLAAQDLLLAGDETSIAAKVVEYKTARYTVQRPAELGATLGNGSKELVESLSRFGLPLGRAFQYRDDLLGVFGDQSITGKPSGDDLKEGKRTLLIAEANRDEKAAKIIKKYLGTEDALDHLAEIRNAIIDSGAVAKLEKQISEDFSTAMEILDETEMTSAGKIALKELAETAVNRES